MNHDCIEKTECRCCGRNDTLKEFINLTDQPLANTYPEHPDMLPLYPLKVNVCTNCWHTQLSHVVNPDLLFRDYLYVSGTSQTLRDYFDWFAEKVTRENGGPGTVLDIACNDGTQLDSFKKLGWRTYGIDPAANLVPIAREKGHTVLCDYCGTTNFDTDKFHARVFDVIVAQNVFAHTDNVKAFLEECDYFLRDNGRIYIQTSQANMYVNGEFDTIYHEHLSFFSVSSMNALLRRVGLFLDCVEYVSVHGTSFLFTIKKTPRQDMCDSTYQICAIEKTNKLYYLPTYYQFGDNAKKLITELHDTVEVLLNDHVVVGYGAAAKGMTVLNYGGIYLDFIIDDNPLKVGRVTPGKNIPIVSRDVLKNGFEHPLVIVPLAWNFFNEIKKNLTQMGIQAKFLKYFPKVELMDQ